MSPDGELADVRAMKLAGSVETPSCSRAFLLRPLVVGALRRDDPLPAASNPVWAFLPLLTARIWLKTVVPECHRCRGSSCGAYLGDITASCQNEQRRVPPGPAMNLQACAHTLDQSHRLYDRSDAARIT